MKKKKHILDMQYALLLLCVAVLGMSSRTWQSMYVYLRPYQRQRQDDGWAFSCSSGHNVRSCTAPPAAEAQPVIHRGVEPGDDVRYAPVTKAVYNSHPAPHSNLISHVSSFINSRKASYDKHVLTAVEPHAEQTRSARE